MMSKIPRVKPLGNNVAGSSVTLTFIPVIQEPTPIKKPITINFEGTRI